jgi:hypothetical protein
VLQEEVLQEVAGGAGGGYNQGRSAYNQGRAYNHGRTVLSRGAAPKCRGGGVPTTRSGLQTRAECRVPRLEWTGRRVPTTRGGVPGALDSGGCAYRGGVPSAATGVALEGVADNQVSTARLRPQSASEVSYPDKVAPGFAARAREGGRSAPLVS